MTVPFMNWSEGIERILDMNLPKSKKTLKSLLSEYVLDFSKIKKSITQGKIPTGPVQLTISFICSRSGRLATLGNRVGDELKRRKPLDLLKERELNSFLDAIYTRKRRNSKLYKEAKTKILRFLKRLGDLESELSRLAESERLKLFEERFENILEDDAKIGRKGRDNLLRDCGFLNHIPIDIHENRFLLRTGIFHKYASLNESDPTDYDHLANAMRRFCEKELKTLKVNGISLSDAPGLVDLIVWYFSQEKTEQEISLGICAKTPLCEKCPLNNICLFGRQHK